MTYVKLEDTIKTVKAIEVPVGGFDDKIDAWLKAIDIAAGALASLPTVSVTDEMVRTAAVAMWRGESVRAAPNVVKQRTAEAFDEESDFTITRWTGLARAALEAALGDTVSDGWEDIATAPRDGTLVLLFEPHSEGGFAFVGCNNLGAEWFNNLDMKEQNPTHWKPLGPLPAPPSE